MKRWKGHSLILSPAFTCPWGHEQGRKSLNMFGPGTIFPVGVEIHEFRVEYEMSIQALTEVEVYKFSYPTLKKMVQENGDFAGEDVIRTNGGCLNED